MDASDVLNKLGISFTEKGNKLAACCPFHSEKTPSFYMFKSSGHYNCFGCGEKGNLNDLVKRLTGKTIFEFMGSSYNYVQVPHVYEKKELKNNEFEVEGLLQNIEEDKRVLDYCWSIGLTNRFIDYFDIKFSKQIKINIKNTAEEEKKTYWNRIVVPCKHKGHVYTYELRDFTKRSSKKVLYPVGSESDILFNYDNIDPTKVVYIVEGIKGLSKIWSYYSTNVISTFGKIIKENQKNLIKKLPYICIVPDNDENKIDYKTGLPVNNLRIMTDIYEEFYNNEYEVAYIPYKGKDPNDLSRSQLKSVLDSRKKYSDIVVNQCNFFNTTKIDNDLYISAL